MEVKKRFLPLHSQPKRRVKKLKRRMSQEANKKKIETDETEERRLRLSETETRRYIKGNREVNAK